MLATLQTVLERRFAFHFFVFVVMASYWGIRVTFMNGLGGDEAEQVLFAQAFDWGYDVSNPPLYTWILMGLVSLFGKSAGLVLGLKLAILFVIYTTLHRAAVLVLGPDRRFDAVLVGLSPFLIYVFAWSSIFSYSHSLLNALFVILTFMAVVKILEDGRVRWYLVLGVLVGLGMLTKYAFGLFLIAVFVAGLTLPPCRARFWTPKIGLSLLVAALILLPHGLWVWDHLGGLEKTLAYKLEVDQQATYIQGVGRGVWSIVLSLFGFMSPMWVILAGLFYAAFKEHDDSVCRSTLNRFLGRLFVVVLVLLVAMVVFGGVTKVRSNYLYLFVLFPMWLIARIPLRETMQNRRRLYAAVAVSAGVASVLALGGKALFSADSCDKCQAFIPYDKIAEHLKDQGFTGGTVFATWYPAPLPGNLALHLNDARVVSYKFHNIKPPREEPQGQCLAVWWPLKHGGQDQSFIYQKLSMHFGYEIDQALPVRRFDFELNGAPGKMYSVDYILATPGGGQCQ